jgi:hypothetical protein
MAGGWAAQRVDDLDDIDAWMAKRNGNVAVRREAEAVGRDFWNQATRDGQDLAAPRPIDLVSIGVGALRQNGQPAEWSDSADHSSPGGGEYDLPLQKMNEEVVVAPQTDPGPITMTTPNYRFATAGSGDSISRLLGTSDPGAIGQFLGLNGMDGRSSTLQIGHSYAAPTRPDDATPDEIATGRHLLQSDNGRLSALRTPTDSNDEATDHIAALINAGINPWTGQYVRPNAPLR